jgi:hypothetical protein
VSKVCSRIPGGAAAAQEPGIDPPGRQRRQLVVVEALADPDPDRRVGVPVGPDDRRQQRQRDRGENRDGQLAPVAPGGEPGQTDRAVGLGQGAPCLPEHRPAGLAEDHPPARPVEQPDTQGSFQVADLPRQRGLADVQAVSRATVVKLVGQRGKRPPQPRVHIHATTLSIKSTSALDIIGTAGVGWTLNASQGPRGIQS